MKYLYFIISLILGLIVSVSILPQLPWFLAPNIMIVLMVVFLIEDKINLLINWSIWGGLVIDLVSSNRLGLIWIPYLIVGSIMILSRKIIILRDFPWLWPFWFLGADLIVNIGLAFITKNWQTWFFLGIATMIWGMVTIIGWRWFISTRNKYLYVKLF